jgi:hypothetical protein
MEWLKEFLEVYRYLVYTVLLLFITLLIIYKYWEKVKFWWLNTSMTFPFFGKIKKLSKDIESRDEKRGWFDSETTLCSDYFNFYNQYDKEPSLYEKSKSYLSKADELGRKPFPTFMWVIISIIVIIEALGFAYVLAGFTLPGASESLQRQGAFGIALLISIILVGFTHWTGHELYKNAMVKKIRVWFANNRNDDKPNLERNDKVTLESNEVDDNDPNYIKLLNRVDTNATVSPTWWVTIITAVFVVVIAIGATYVRGQVLEKQLTQEVENISSGSIYDIYPSELSSSQASADDKAFKDRQNSDRKGGWATFIVLAFIFTFIQILGILFGYKWGFIGKESKVAYLNSNRFNSRQEFINYHKTIKQQIAKIAQQKLHLLQQQMAQRASMIGTSAKQSELIKQRENRTFLDYVHMKHEEDSIHEQKEYSRKKKYTIEEDVVPMSSYKAENEKIDDKKVSSFCTECGTEISSSDKFCPNCGAKTEEKPKVPTCPTCNSIYEEGKKFCPNDGTALELK